MNIESTKIFFVQAQNQCLFQLDEIKNWVQGHSTTAKILKIAGLILGVGLLASIPFTLLLGIGFRVDLLGVGLVTTIASIILFARSFPINQENQSIHPTNSWLHLEQKTRDQLQGIEYLPESALNHRFSDIRCPRKTAVSIAGKHLHANKVGEGIAERAFVASQAPLVEDYEMFWKAIFEGEPTIFDLTTLKDQVDSGVTKYYPDVLNKTLKYGSMSVKLIEEKGDTYTYQVQNDVTGVIKNIRRCHYQDWKDFGAVSLSALKELVKKVETLSPNPKSLVWVHCRAGVGRTGTLITALVLKEKIGRGEINKENLAASLENIIVEMRKQRGSAFVQQEVQLNLLHQYAEFLIGP